MKNSIKQLVCGIQFLNAFKMLDKWGSITDEFLSVSAQKIFGQNYFTNVSGEIGYQRSIGNEITKNNIRLTQNNLIFTHNLNGTKTFEQEFNFFKNAIIKFLVPNIVSKNLLVVSRIGIVFTNNLTEDKIDLFKSKIINQEISNEISDFRFSQKSTLPTSLLNSGTEDYVNKIYTIGNVMDNNLGISYDYQHFFIPPNALVEKSVPVIIDDAFKNLEIDVFKRIEAEDGK